MTNEGQKLAKHLGGHANRCHVDEGALRWLVANCSIRSMLDIGCGTGDMQSVADLLKVQWTGAEGDSSVAKDNTMVHDYTIGCLPPTGRFDLAWSVEFLEHVDAKYLPAVMDSFKRCRWAAITHALPGKRGWHHVNCQLPEYWIQHFNENGFTYKAEETNQLRASSTMRRNFMRKNGLLFQNRYD